MFGQGKQGDFGGRNIFSKKEKEKGKKRYGGVKAPVYVLHAKSGSSEAFIWLLTANIKLDVSLFSWYVCLGLLFESSLLSLF